MKGLNQVTLIGNVGADPEVKTSNSGTRVAKFSLATNESYVDRAGAKQEKVSWHRITVFGKLVDVVEQYVHKGDPLYVQGKIQYSEVDGDAGKKYFTDIIVFQLIMLGSKGGSSSEERQPSTTRRSMADRPAQRPDADLSQPDDDLPF